MDKVQELILIKLKNDTTWEHNVIQGTPLYSKFDKWILSLAIRDFDMEKFLKGQFKRQLLGKPVDKIDDLLKPFKEEMTDDLLEGIPTHMCRVVTISELEPGVISDFVEFTDLFLIVDTKEGKVTSIWEHYWNEYRASNDSVEGGIRGIEEFGGEFYRQLGNPFKGDRDKNITLDWYKERYNKKYGG